MKTIFEKYRQELNEELKNNIKQNDVPLYKMMRYHLGWTDKNGQLLQKETQGKLIRPTFCLLACEALGGDLNTVLPAASAIELIHNFSLIHDDIEDNSPYRRSRPTVWKLWGQPKAINAGDAMHTLGIESILRLNDRGVQPVIIIRAVSALNEACLRLCEGQDLDLLFESLIDININDYLKMVEGKTAALFACAMKLGALLSNNPVNDRIMKMFFDFGHDIGIAFQIQDDIFGIWGKDRITGKSSDSDIMQRKKTLPVVYALENLTGNSRDILVQYYGANTFKHDEIDLIRKTLEKAGSKEYAASLGAYYYDKGVKGLASTGLSEESLKSLIQAAATLVNREF